MSKQLILVNASIVVSRSFSILVVKIYHVTPLRSYFWIHVWAIELASKRLGTKRGKNNMAAATNTEKSFSKYLVCVPSMYCMPGLMRLGLSWAIIFSRTVWRNCYCQIFRCFFLVDIHEFCWESVSLTPLTGSSISIANQNGSLQVVHKGSFCLSITNNRGNDSGTLIAFVF